jgi:hypothetical protein
MIDQVRTSEDAEVCKRLLAAMSIMYRPITLIELAALVEIPDDLSDDDEALLEIIAICGSFLTWREDFIVFIHQSAKEFLLDKARVDVFSEDKEAEHLAIFSRSLQTMSSTLQHNILNINLVGNSTEEFTHLRSNPLAAIKYACVYWVDHLLEGSCGEDKYHSLDDGGCVHRFLRQKYLHWLEGLGILGCVPEGISAMLKLEDLLQVGDCLNFENISTLTRHFIEKWRITRPTRPSSRRVPIYSILQTCNRKQPPSGIQFRTCL